MSIREEIDRLAREQGTYLTTVHTPSGMASYLTRRLDGGEIQDPPIYPNLASAYIALTHPSSRISAA